MTISYGEELSSFMLRWRGSLWKAVLKDLIAFYFFYYVILFFQVSYFLEALIAHYYYFIAQKFLIYYFIIHFQEDTGNFIQKCKFQIMKI